MLAALPAVWCAVAEIGLFVAVRYVLMSYSYEELWWMLMQVRTVPRGNNNRDRE